MNPSQKIDELLNEASKAREEFLRTLKREPQTVQVKVPEKTSHKPKRHLLEFINSIIL